MKNGFYWVICESVGSEPQIAEFDYDEWFLCGFSKAFTDKQVTVLSEKLSNPEV